MNLADLIEALKLDTLRSLGLFQCELILSGTIVALLLVRLVGLERWLPAYWTALTGAVAAFVCALVQFAFMKGTEGGVAEGMFTGLLVYDKFTIFFRLYLLLFLILMIALTVLSGIPDNEDGPDFYALMLGSTIGMMLMISANNLLILFLGIEMASVPSYAMVGFLKGRKRSSEASFKYVVFGAGAAGVMLYGISLIGGLLGTLELPLLAERLALVFGGGASLADPTVLTLLLAILMVLTGIAFKLSVVPFHFWCPDAFEGAAAEVGGFLSVASKGAAFALLVRFGLALSGGASPGELATLLRYVGLGIGAIAALTATFGNLAAYAQTNVKRLLAYSTIAHAGYMLMAVAALMVLLNPATGEANPESVARAIEGLMYYLAVYLFMNLGAFAIVAFLRNEILSEEIDDYNGLARQFPILCVSMLVCMFSLVGMPPLGGFVGKFMIFYSLFEAGSVHPFLWVILVFGGLNTVFSLVYYLRVLKAMFMGERPEEAPSLRPANGSLNAYALMMAVPVLVLGVHIGPLSATASSVAHGLIAPLFR